MGHASHGSTLLRSLAVDAHLGDRCRVGHLALLLLFQSVLLSYLLFDLLEGLKEELFHLAALVQDHL